MRQAISARRLFDGTAMLEDRCVLLDGAKIEAVSDRVPAGVTITRLPEGQILTPGYVDLQVNGGGGVMFNDATNQAGVAAIVAAHRALGTTSLLPTLISGRDDQVRAALSVGPVDGAPGVHIEGPFLNPRRRGIHPAAAIRLMGEEDVSLLTTPTHGVRLVTLAPELAPPDVIARLVRAGVVVFAGHSDADWNQMAAALNQGLRGVTHLFNAMSQITPREPGVVGAALAMPNLMAGLILDGVHVHPGNARTAFACLGPARLFLVSDAMRTVGSTTASLRVGDTDIRLRDGRLTAADGTLGGAHLCMAEAVRHAVRQLEVSIADALRMATATPADAAGIIDRGRLLPGMRADLLALNGELEVQHIWVGGEMV